MSATTTGGTAVPPDSAATAAATRVREAVAAMPDVVPPEYVLLTPEQVSAVTQIGTAALAQQRYSGRGIPFVRFAGRKVRYRLVDLQAYIEANRMTRTDGRQEAS